ncbi:MAG: T9SS type A sorting domain-containing protein [Flavobacteriales bacterium]|nr:T9SS type A sorting domain-containing protein [Flavobacteriales bacterium]
MRHFQLLRDLSWRSLLLSAPMAALFGLVSTAQTVNTDWWHISSGQVNAMVPSADGEVVYMGGSFNYVGPVITYGALLDLNLGQPAEGLPMPDNTVRCSVADGAGGWYIGGEFSQVGGEARGQVAHINADGSLNAWQVDVQGGRVYSLLLDGSTLYIGGTFLTVGGESRAGVAAVDANTGSLLPFAPVLGNALFPRAEAMVAVGTKLIIGGDFESINGTGRRFLGAVDKLTGELQSWNPDPSSRVFSVVLSEDGSTVYVGGSFTSIAGQSRTRTAAFNTATLALLPWTVSATDAVLAMGIEGSVMVLGGEFETLGGQAREHLGAVDVSTAAVLDWVADTDDDVFTMALYNGIVHVGGRFREVGGEVRRYVAAVDLATAAITDWDPVAGSNVYTLSVGGDKVFAGGWFTSIGGKVRNHLMAMDLATGRPTDWDAHAERDYGSISSLCLSPDGQVLYAAGSFVETIGGQARKHMVALDVNTGLARPWAPEPDAQVSSIVLSPNGGTLYAAGFFVNVDGVQRRRLAAFNADPQQTELLPWDPHCSAGVVQSLALSSDGSTLYAGGSFSASGGTIGGQPRDRLVALTTTENTNNATAWSGAVNGPNSIGSLATTVHTLLIEPSSGALYIGGLFNGSAGHTISGAARDNIAALSIATGEVLPWDPGANDRVTSLGWSRDGELMVCGTFDGADAIGGAERQGFAVVDPISGAVDPWSVSFNSGGYGVRAIEVGDHRILSGFFAEVNGQDRLGLVAFDLSPASISENPGGGSLQVYPNPTEDDVRLPLLLEARTIDVFDITGRSALRVDYSRSIALQGLTRGVYILVVRDGMGKELGRARVIRD